MIGSIRVLLADDHGLVRDTLAALLAGEAGIEVVGAAPDAGRALEMARIERPDVVVMDIDMPGRSAFEVARELRAEVPGARVIFLSAYLHDSYIEQALAAEAAGYLTKEESPERLVAAIRRVAAGRVQFSAAVGDRIVVDGRSVHLAAGPSTRLQLLTPRELEVLGHLARGLSKKSIARILDLSVKTVEKHCDHVMEKLDIHDRVQLARFAIREGLARP